ncbi:putative zinc-binding metallopeptidase [Citreimonas sp.]|uniref:zinc-binding metallopeptidase family protein n=1 Tax=Citreimonas sp. TaxID=3036715 RepID=UPI0035C7977C
MQTYRCAACAGVLYFDNLECGCGQQIAYDPVRDVLVPLDVPCANRDAIGCNWTGPAGGGLCLSCAMTDVHPDTSVDANRLMWARAEGAKRWALANLMRWGWFRGDDPQPRFHLLSEQTGAGAENVTMGHADGLITINVTEASHPTRIARREALSERYRTMIGHFRHEIAHFLFTVLARDPAFLAAFRNLFGDERQDYAAALQAHYEGGPRDPGPDYITFYAGAHPHEDWAETSAHLMHLTDLTDSVAAAGLRHHDVTPPADAYAETDAVGLINTATALALAINHVNRSLEIPDLYPFVLTDTVRDKLSFTHHWLRHPLRAAQGKTA